MQPPGKIFRAANNFCTYQILVLVFGYFHFSYLQDLIKKELDEEITIN